MKVRVMGIAALLCAAVWARPETATAEGESLESLASGVNVAIDQVIANPDVYAKALLYPEVLLDLSGVVLPPGVELGTFSPMDGKPFEPTGPTIELTQCRTIWACDPTDQIEPCWAPQPHEVCFGFRVIDGRVPGPAAK